jgi:hypothetical protein
MTTSKKTTNAPAPPFGDYITKFLLSGPGQRDAMPDAARRAELEQAIGRFGERIGECWRQHHVWLRSEAARLEIKPRFPGNRYFSEALAAGR